MASTIKLKNGSGEPLATDLVTAEPAFDLTNKRLYTEDSGGTVIEVGTNPSTITIPDGTIDNTVIGGTTTAAGSFTTLQADTSLNVDGTVTADGLTVDTDTLYVDATNDRVGIGTTSPSANLHVKGSTGIIVQDDSGSLAQIQFLNSTGTNILTAKTGADDMFFDNTSGDTVFRYSGTTEAMRIDSSGNVGIGRTPVATLHVEDAVSTVYSSSSLPDSADCILTIGNKQTSETTNDHCTLQFNVNGGTHNRVGAISFVAENSANRQGAMAFSVDNGTTREEAMRIDSSGNLLVGGTDTFPGNGDTNTGASITASGNAAFSCTSNRTLFNRNSTDGDIIEFRKDGTAVGSIASVGGNVGIGNADTGIYFSANNDNIVPCNLSTTPPSNRDNAVDLGASSVRFKDLYLSNAVYIDTGNLASNPRVYFDNDNFTGLSFIEVDRGTNAMEFWNQDSERMRIDSSGNLLVGTTAELGGSNAKLYVSNLGDTYCATLEDDSGNTGFIRFNNASGTQVGSITRSGTSTVYGTSSDYRLKENVVDMTGAVDRVKALPVKRFNFIADPAKTVDGFLAHEAQEVVPEAVTGTKDAMQTEEYEVTPAVLDEDGNVVTEAVMGTREVPDYQGIDQSKLVPLLTGALQEAIARIETLEAQVATLQGN